MSKERPVKHQFEGESLESVFVGRRDGQPRPTIILIPTVMGVSELEKLFGRQLVELGYNALVADLFGKEFHGAPRDTMFGEMNRLRSDRAALRRRLEHVLSLFAVSRKCKASRSSSPAIVLVASALSILPGAART